MGQEGINVLFLPHVFDSLTAAAGAERRLSAAYGASFFLFFFLSGRSDVFCLDFGGPLSLSIALSTAYGVCVRVCLFVGWLAVCPHRQRRVREGPLD
jgi:hypothetical protein